MWESIRGYLTFTRKERYGVLFLLILISILFVLPYFFKPEVGDPDPAAYEKMKSGIQKFESRATDSSREADMHGRYHNSDQYAVEKNAGEEDKPTRTNMFYFDPNTIRSVEWRRLGMPERLTQTIIHYVGKGGRFHKAEDLKKLYGLRNSDYERISPYVRISKPPENFQSRGVYYAKSAYKNAAIKNPDSLFREASLSPGNIFARTTKRFVITDINQSDSSDWSLFPGVGAKLASRIIHFREKLGGFYQLEQVAETFGLPDSTYEKIKPYLKLNAASLTRIDLNTATKEILQSHPYIRWQIAKEIIEYRQQHGSFHSEEELLQLALMDQARFEKLKPYLIVKP